MNQNTSFYHMVYLSIILILNTTTYQAQNQSSKKDVRITIGGNISVLPGKPDQHLNHYQFKTGLTYRQCFKAYLLQAELNYLLHIDPALATHGPHGHSAYFVDESYVNQYILNTQQLGNIQFSLSKGWTNETINIYLGAGLSAGYGQIEIHDQKLYRQVSIDSLTQEPIPDINTYKNSSEKYEANYLTVGLVAKATMEVKIYKRFSGTIQFSPEFNNSIRLKTATSDLFKKNNFQFNWSGLELGLHYRI